MTKKKITKDYLDVMKYVVRMWYVSKREIFNFEYRRILSGKEKVIGKFKMTMIREDFLREIESYSKNVIVYEEYLQNELGEEFGESFIKFFGMNKKLVQEITPIAGELYDLACILHVVQYIGCSDDYHGKIKPDYKVVKEAIEYLCKLGYTTQEAEEIIL